MEEKEKKKKHEVLYHKIYDGIRRTTSKITPKILGNPPLLRIN